MSRNGCSPGVAPWTGHRPRDVATATAILGLALSYVLLYVTPTLFAGAQQLRLMPPFPVLDPIGADLVRNVRKCARLLREMPAPWDAFVFSPLWVGLFGALSVLPAELARWTVVIVDCACFVATWAWAPRWFSEGRPPRPAALVFGVAGLFSYGFLLELERGQWNLAALLLAVYAVKLWHAPVRRGRWYATALYVLATHLKLWPAVFALGFVEPREGWRRNALRLLAVEACNVLALLVLGLGAFRSYLHVFATRTLVVTNDWSGNHSITSFANLMGQRFDLRLAVVVAGYACTLGAAALVLYVAFSRGSSGRHPMVLLTCMLLAMLLPKISHDYKLSALTAVVAIYFGAYDAGPERSRWRGHLSAAALGVMSLCFCLTLYANWQKRFAGLFTPNTPLLVGMLLLLAALALLQRRRVEVTAGEAEPGQRRETEEFQGADS